MQIGIFSAAYFDFEVDTDGLKRMRKHGYTCMDYNFLAYTDNCRFYRYDDETFVKNLTELRKQINGEGIEICQTHGPWRWPPQDFEEADREERFEKMCKAIVATKILGAKYCVIHPIMPFGWDQDPYPDKFWQMNKEFFTRLTKVGEEHGVIVCLENMPMPALSIASPEATLRMVKEINSPYIKMCLDTGHSIITGVQPGAAVRQIGKEYLACLHVHDNNGKNDQHLIPYSGVIDWQDFSKALQDIGYEGTMSLETNIDHSFDPPEHLREHFEIGLAKIAKELASDSFQA